MTANLAYSKSYGQTDGTFNQATNTITIATNTLQSNQLPTTSSYIFFSKDNKVNSSSILGYYAEVTFKNNSTTEAELFSIGCVIGESSK